MTYCLGVDLGTSFTAAAVFEGGRAEIVELGQRRPQMPTVVYIPPSGKPAIGDAAERRAVNEPERVVREFKRRLGDQVGSLVGDEFWTAEALMARVLVHVLTEVTRQQGEKPMLVALTHPANWGPYKLELLAEVARLAQLSDDKVLFVSEPVAAAVHHSHRGRTASGQRYVVYDLGGGTFDATVVQVHEGEDGDSRSASVLGEPGGLERLGGMDFDEALRRLVERLVGQRLEDLDTSDPRVLHGLAQLRNELVEAKEALSTETHVEVPLFLPGAPPVVRVTRAEFEQAIRPRLHDTMVATDQVLRSAGVDDTSSDPVTVLLVGGSSRVPLVSAMVSEVLELPTALDEHPKHAVALGAARVAAQRAGLASAPVATPHDQAVGVPPTSDPEARSGALDPIEAAAAALGLAELEALDEARTAFHATWGDEGRRVAVHVLTSGDSGPLDRAWVDAVTGLARHPYLLSTLAVDQLGEHAWPGAAHGRLVITEPRRGEPLDVELAARGAVSVADAVAIGVQLAGALATLHRHRLVHGRVTAEAVTVTSWARSPKIKLGLVGGASEGDAFVTDAHAVAQLLASMLTGETIDRSSGAAASLHGRAVPRPLVEALALLESGEIDHTTIQQAGRILQRVELAEGRIPTECTTLGPEPDGSTTPLRPTRPLPARTVVDLTVADRDWPQFGGPDDRTGADQQVAEWTDGSESVPAAAATAGASGSPVVTRRLQVVTPPNLKAGWGDAADSATAAAAPPRGFTARSQGAHEPDWVRYTSQPATEGRSRGSQWSNVITRWVIPAVIGAVLATAAVLVLLGR